MNFSFIQPVNSRIPADIEARIKAVPLPDFIRRYEGNPLQRSGAQWLTLCRIPPHIDHNPSLAVSEKGFKCFSCGKGGANAVAYIMARENLDYRAALERVAEIWGIDIPRGHGFGFGFGSFTAPKPSPKPATTPTSPLPAPTSPAYVSEQEIADLNLLPIAAPEDTMLSPLLRYLRAVTFGTAQYHQIAAVSALYGHGVCRGIGGRYAGYDAFPLRDIKGRLCRVKLMRYTADGHRDKSKGENGRERSPILTAPFRREKPACFFGEHTLILQKGALPVGIVESEKTAEICALLMPTHQWIATASKGQLRPLLEKSAPWLTQAAAAGIDVVLWPDIDAVDDWNDIAADWNDRHEEAPVKSWQNPEAYREALRRGLPDKAAAKADIADSLLWDFAHEPDGGNASLFGRGDIAPFDDEGHRSAPYSFLAECCEKSPALLRALDTLQLTPDCYEENAVPHPPTKRYDDRGIEIPDTE